MKNSNPKKMSATKQKKIEYQKKAPKARTIKFGK